MLYGADYERMSNCCCDKIFNLNFKLKVFEDAELGGVFSSFSVALGKPSLIIFISIFGFLRRFQRAFSLWLGINNSPSDSRRQFRVESVARVSLLSRCWYLAMKFHFKASGSPSMRWDGFGVGVFG